MDFYCLILLTYRSKIVVELDSVASLSVGLTLVWLVWRFIRQQQQQQRLRRKLISDGCRSEERWSASKIKTASGQKGFTLLVDDRLRYIYCRVAKVASTTWSRVLLVASGKVILFTAEGPRTCAVRW